MKRMPVQIGLGCGDIRAKGKRYVNEVLRTQRLSYGPFTRKFETMFSQVHGCRYGLMVNSGTSALRIAVAALKEVGGWKDGDEVICPAVTFIASSNVIIMNNLTPVFVDITPTDYNLDPEKIEEKITKRTRAIMVVHLFGQPAQMDKIMAVARKHKLKVIEDSCETMFAKYRGKTVGSFGDVSCFSTYMAHFIVTGVGGLALTNASRLAGVMRSMANHGRDLAYTSMDDDKNLTPAAFRRVVARRFRFVRLGYSFRATEMEAALGVEQLERKNEIIRTRRKNAAFLTRGLADLERWVQLPRWPAHSEHMFMMYPVVLKAGAPVSREDLLMHLEFLNIETRDFLPLINQPVYKKMFGLSYKDFPVSHWTNTHGFYIGCHQKLTRRELQFVVDAFHDFFRRKKLIA